MKRSSKAAAALIGLAAVTAATPSPVQAAEIKVLIGGALTKVMKDLAPEFEARTGRHVEMTFGATPQLAQKIAAGAAFDFVVAPAELYKDPQAQAKVLAEPTAVVARIGYGVSVRAGAGKPDISTPEAFRQALLGAKSVTFLRESAAGAYVAKVFDRLGIAEAMKAKTVAQALPTGVSEAVASGKAEMGVFLTSVLAGPGVDFVGPFPAELQQDLVFVAAVGKDGADAEGAKAFMDFLVAPETKGKIKAAGITPG